MPVSQGVNAKEKFMEEMRGAPPVNTRMMRKHSSLIVDMERVFLVCRRNICVTHFVWPGTAVSPRDVCSGNQAKGPLAVVSHGT